MTTVLRHSALAIAMSAALVSCKPPPPTQLAPANGADNSSSPVSAVIVDIESVEQAPGFELPERVSGGMVVRARLAKGEVVRVAAGPYAGQDRIEILFEQRDFHLAVGRFLLLLDAANRIVRRLAVDENDFVTVDGDPPRRVPADDFARQCIEEGESGS